MNKSSEIRVRDLHKRFDESQPEVLRGVSIDFPPGKLTYILGPSGTGKSVLIKHVLGLLHPDQGSVNVDGVEITQLGHKDLQQYRTKIGMLFQNSALFDDMTVFDNVAFPLLEHTDLSAEEIHEKVVKTLAILGMKEGLKKFPFELSGGMKKRVGLARAIIREPSILLYDEPTTGLDPVTRSTVDDLIDQLKRNLGLTSVVISHDIPSALRLADHIIFLFGGEVIFHGTSQEFRKASHPKIREFLDAENRSAALLFAQEQN